MRSLKRFAVRLILVVCGIAALLSIVAAFYFKGGEAIETWLVVAAALAVLTSLSSAWAAQVTIEIQEDQLRPDVVIYIDSSERYQLMQLRIKNIGRGSAFNITDHWNDRLRDYRDRIIRFTEDGRAISSLHPDQNLSKSINVPHNYYQNYSGEIYRGHVIFEDISGYKYRRNFVIDPSHHLDTLLYDQEAVRTHYELQRLPEKLDEIRKEISKAVQFLQVSQDREE